MKQIIYNAQTKETTIVDVPDEEFPEPVIITPELTIDEKVAQLAEQMVIAQRQLELSQEAIDFLIMGGV